MQRRVPVALLVAALASAGAGVVHLTVAADHWSLWWGYGVQFLAAALIQIGWAIAALLSRNRALLATGAAMQALFIGAWAVTRTVGRPFGPAAGTAETVGYPGVLTVLLELIAIGGVLLAMARAFAPTPRSARYVASAGAGSAVVLAAAGIAVLTAVTGGHHGTGGHSTGSHHGGIHHQNSTPQESGKQGTASGHHESPTTNPAPESSTPAPSAPSPTSAPGAGDGHAHQH